MQRSTLTGKQQAFADAYLSCLNATESARRAGYKGNDVTLGQVGAENLKKPQIQIYLSERQKSVIEKAGKQIINVYDEFLEQLHFAKNVRQRAEALLDSPDAADRKFVLEALKVCDMAIDKFAKLGGDYTKDKENPADLSTLADVVKRYRADVAKDAATYEGTKGQFGAAMPSEDEMRVEIERLCRHSKVEYAKLASHIEQQELGSVG